MTAIVWTGIACAAALALVGLWAWLWRTPRVWPSCIDDWRRTLDAIDAEQKRRAEWTDEIGDPTRAQIDQTLDVIAEPDHRRAEHMNRTLRRVTEEDQ